MPVRTGLLGVSAAMAVGAVAVASGLLPGGEKFVMGESTSGQQVRESASGQLSAQGGASATPSGRPSAPVSGEAASQGASSTSGKTSATPSQPKTKAPETTKPAAPEKKAPEKPVQQKTEAPERRAPAAPPKPPRSKAPTGANAAEAAVLQLVNEERAKVGCSPVRANASLASLAGAFSADMATRGFFDHTDLDGDTPWDRAAQAGITGMAAENIARGQADAETVMRSWMNSDGHRANILNCDYRTMGVGVYFADGGPWWTQDFGF
ncbi:CAP domain-containing protein [Streptomyces sp. NPDC002133]|uniref:CAP domain-containing protein n=1 Tax=Streptomyces sp. NPDC002133 TaxID=3154409 RepID=UPI00331A31CD